MSKVPPFMWLLRYGNHRYRVQSSDVLLSCIYPTKTKEIGPCMQRRPNKKFLIGQFMNLETQRVKLEAQEKGKQTIIDAWPKFVSLNETRKKIFAAERPTPYKEEASDETAVAADGEESMTFNISGEEENLHVVMESIKNHKQNVQEFIDKQRQEFFLEFDNKDRIQLEKENVEFFKKCDPHVFLWIEGLARNEFLQKKPLTQRQTRLNSRKTIDALNFLKASPKQMILTYMEDLSNSIFDDKKRFPDIPAGTKLADYFQYKILEADPQSFSLEQLEKNVKEAWSIDEPDYLEDLLEARAQRKKAEEDMARTSDGGDVTSVIEDVMDDLLDDDEDFLKRSNLDEKAFREYVETHKEETTPETLKENEKDVKDERK